MSILAVVVLLLLCGAFEISNLTGHGDCHEWARSAGSHAARISVAYGSTWAAAIVAAAGSAITKAAAWCGVDDFVLVVLVCTFGWCTHRIYPGVSMINWTEVWDHYSRLPSGPRRWIRRRPYAQKLVKNTSTVLSVLTAVILAALFLSESVQTEVHGIAPSREWRFQKPDALIWHAHICCATTSDNTDTTQALHITDNWASPADHAALQLATPLELYMPSIPPPAALHNSDQQPLWTLSYVPQNPGIPSFGSPGYHLQQTMGQKALVPDMGAVHNPSLWPLKMDPFVVNYTLSLHKTSQLTTALHTHDSWQPSGAAIPHMPEHSSTASDTCHTDKSTALAVHSSTATSHQCAVASRASHGVTTASVLKHAPGFLLIHPSTPHFQQLHLAALMQPFGHNKAESSNSKHINSRVLTMLPAAESQKPIIHTPGSDTQTLQKYRMGAHTPVLIWKPADTLLQEVLALQSNTSLCQAVSLEDCPLVPGAVINKQSSASVGPMALVRVEGTLWEAYQDNFQQLGTACLPVLGGIVCLAIAAGLVMWLAKKAWTGAGVPSATTSTANATTSTVPAKATHASFATPAAGLKKKTVPSEPLSRQGSKISTKFDTTEHIAFDTDSSQQQKPSRVTTAQSILPRDVAALTEAASAYIPQPTPPPSPTSMPLNNGLRTSTYSLSGVRESIEQPASRSASSVTPLDEVTPAKSSSSWTTEEPKEAFCDQSLPVEQQSVADDGLDHGSAEASGGDRLPTLDQANELPDLKDAAPVKPLVTSATPLGYVKASEMLQRSNNTSSEPVSATQSANINVNAIAVQPRDAGAQTVRSKSVKASLSSEDSKKKRFTGWVRKRLCCGATATK